MLKAKGSNKSEQSLETVKETKASGKVMPGSAIVLKTLTAAGIDTIFGYPGGAVLPIYDSLIEADDVEHVLVRHEQGAAHAAEGYARSTGKIGVLLVTSGPGITNAITGLTDAYMDSIPLLCISGQVPTHMIGTDAFQEADATGLTRPCTKHNFLVKHIEDLQDTLEEAIEIAQTGRPGPVLIDIPKDIQLSEIEYKKGKQKTKIDNSFYLDTIKTHPSPFQVERAVKMMKSAQRPVFYTGGGVINAGSKASEALRELVELTGFPITSTLMGLGAYPGDDEKFLGMLGMHGTYEANMAMHECDLMINIGARFDDRITGRVSDFSPYSKKIHIDIDDASIGKNIPVDLEIVGDAGIVMEELLKALKKQKSFNKKHTKDWWETIAEWRARNCLSYTQGTNVDDRIRPQYAIDRLYQKTRDMDCYITTEVGQHQMWAAQYYRFKEPNRFMTSGGLGTMGYGLPAAIGTQKAHAEALVVDISGDASFQMNVQELGTAIQYNLPVKVFILNNQWMGMVRQWQELIHGERYSQSYSKSQPDFVKLADAYGWKGLRAETYGELDALIDDMLAHDGPVIADVRVVNEENCFPMIPSGAAHNEMLLPDSLNEEDE